MFHMTNAGVDNVWLADGYQTGEDKFGPYYSIEDVPGVYRAIAMALVHGGPTLSNRELRLLRRQLELTQAQLGERIGRTEQTVLLWERSGKIPADAARQVKLMALERLAPNITLTEAFRTIDQPRPAKIVLSRRTGEWGMFIAPPATQVAPAIHKVVRIYLETLLQRDQMATLDPIPCLVATENSIVSFSMESTPSPWMNVLEQVSGRKHKESVQ